MSEAWQMQPPQGEPLYTADTDLTEAAYKRMVWTLRGPLLKEMDVDLCILILLLGVLLKRWVFCLVAVLAVQLWLWFMMRRLVHNGYTRSRTLNKGATHWCFYQDCMTTESAAGQQVLHYADLLQIREDEGSFYFLITENAGAVLDAAGCPAELADFLRSLPQVQTKPRKKNVLLHRVVQVLCIVALLLQLLYLIK